MKHLKRFNEELITKSPQYTKGEILIFPKEEYAGEMSMGAICRELGYEYDESYGTEDYYLVKVPVGKEEESGQDFIDSYPEFFTGYERRNIRDEELYDMMHSLNLSIDDLEDMIGKKILSDKWNDKIDNIIEFLNRMKF